MASVNYYLKGAISKDKIEELKRSDSKFLSEALNKKKQIYLKVSSGGERIQVYTKKRIEQYFWNAEKQEIDLKRKRDGLENNGWLGKFKKQIEAIAIKKENVGKRINHAEISNVLSQMTVEKPNYMIFDELFEKFLQEHKTSDGYTLKNSTIVVYNTFLKHIKNFSNSKKIKLDLINLDKEFLLAFKDYLTKEAIAKKVKTEDGVIKEIRLSDNTVSKI